MFETKTTVHAKFLTSEIYKYKPEVETVPQIRKYGLRLHVHVRHAFTSLTFGQVSGALERLLVYDEYCERDI